MHPRKATLAAALLLLLAGTAAADIVVLTNGRKLRGGFAEVGDTVVVNPYFSRHPEMVFGVQRFPRAQVKELIREDPPLVTFLDMRRQLKDDDFEGLLKLAEVCKDNKMKAERDLVLLDILRADPTHEAALRAIGKSKFKKIAKGNPEFDAEVRARVAEYLGMADPEERRKAYAKMKRERSLSLPQEYFDRMIRGAAQPKGLTKDRPLTLGSAESPGVYTVLVPEAYDPRRAWPLVIGLHGGGRGGKDGTEVVGSGPSAMNFYEPHARERGYLVVCPTALRMPWGSTPNVAYLRSLIDEVKLLYNVDVNRIYLTGHSAGGFGTWSLGPRFAEELAAVSPMAGGGGPNSKLADSNTPVFIFHGADDSVVGPGSDRNAAKAMADSGHDWHYTELTGVDHGFPRSIQLELFDFFDLRRLAVGRGRKVPTAEVRSSFLAKVSKAEKRYLGDPLEFGSAGGGGKTAWKKLLSDLKLGGGSAEAAATQLGELAAKDSVKPIGDLLRNPKTPDDVKAHAARALGLIGHEDGYSGLAAGLRSDRHEVVTASATAMAAIGAPKSAEALVSALAHVTKSLEGKRMGDRIHISDWSPWLEALRAVVTGVGVAKAEGGAAAIHRTVVKSVYSGKWEVLYSTRVRMDPWTPRLKLAEAVCATLVALAQPEGRAALTEMRDAKPDPRDNRNPSVVAACEAALLELGE